LEKVRQLLEKLSLQSYFEGFEQNGVHSLAAILSLPDSQWNKLGVGAFNKSRIQMTAREMT